MSTHVAYVCLLSLFVYPHLVFVYFVLSPCSFSCCHLGPFMYCSWLWNFSCYCVLRFPCIVCWVSLISFMPCICCSTLLMLSFGLMFVYVCSPFNLYIPIHVYCILITFIQCVYVCVMFHFMFDMFGSCTYFCLLLCMVFVFLLVCISPSVCVLFMSMFPVCSFYVCPMLLIVDYAHA